MAPQRRRGTYSRQESYSRQGSYTRPTNHAARSAHARADREFRTYDTSYIRPKRSRAPIVIAVIVLIVIVVAIVLLIRSCTSTEDVELLPEGEQAVVEVEQGEAATAIGQSLVDAQLIPNVNEFVSLVNSQDAASSLIPGTYVFEGGDSTEQILKALTTGPSSTGFTVTIPEGYTRDSIADTVESSTDGLIKADDFLDATEDASVYASDYSFLSSAGKNSLEGFLFPKTYEVTAADDAESVTRMMLDQFKKETASLSWSYPKSQDLDEYEAVTLASIVEKEAADVNRPTVASVFYNRLDSDRPYLESDATTAYEVGHDPTADEVHSDSKYSTYTNEGLPPTPICSPSLDSIKAVCDPDDTDYLFFYFTEDDKGKKEYYFSETYEEHQDAIDS